MQANVVIEGSIRVKNSITVSFTSKIVQLLALNKMPYCS